MAVFHTAGEPRSNGSTRRANSGCTRSSRAALTKSVRAWRATMRLIRPVKRDDMTGARGQSKLQSAGAGGLQLRCQDSARVVRSAFMEVEATEEQKKQARRVQKLLYGLMFVMIVAPVIVFLLRMR